MVFIDGPRQRLKEYADTPLAPLFPVEWKGAGVREDIMKLALTERGAALAPFALSPEKSQNVEVWSNLRPSHWLSGGDGAARRGDAGRGRRPAERSVPAVVSRPFGAGKVLYQAFDDSWRWRYEVADQYHVRYWNQIANWIAELPFAVRDKFISLDAGAHHLPARRFRRSPRAPARRPGPAGHERRGRCRASRATGSASPRSASRRTTMPAGFSAARTAALEPGNYEVAVESAAIAERDARRRARASKSSRCETGELTQLSLNEDLLRQMSAATRRRVSARGKHRPPRRAARADQPGPGDRERHRALAELLVVSADRPAADRRVDHPQTRRDAVTAPRRPSGFHAVGRPLARSSVSCTARSWAGV